MPKLAHSLNRPVSVVIPAFFGDDAPRRCILVDIESAGLWFRGDAVNERLGELIDAAVPGDALADVFFPYEQIVYVFDPAQFAFVARNLAARNAPRAPDKLDKSNKPDGPNDPATRASRRRHPDERPKHKNAKRTR